MKNNFLFCLCVCVCVPGRQAGKQTHPVARGRFPSPREQPIGTIHTPGLSKHTCFCTNIQYGFFRQIYVALCARAAAARPGFELFCDLCLADCLATGGAASRVVIQLKGHPTFVSDAMAKDMMAMIDLLAGLDAAAYPR